MPERKRFDLNIEKILDNWEVYHAVREIIANALDEMKITKTKPISIFKDDKGLWHIRDYGRGFQYQHLTQNENDEKKNRHDVIGKFGIGLKDALAVLNKNGIDVYIYSKWNDISLGMLPKEDFPDTITLHALVAVPSQPDMIGTDVIINVLDEDIKSAENLFLFFSDKMPLEINAYGEIYEKPDYKRSSIYVHGVKVAVEENYLFDYNITRTNAKLEKSMNRERSAVGRGAYSDLVKQMLLNAESNEVINKLMDELHKLQYGAGCDEIKYKDIQAHCIKLYNEYTPSVFIPMSKAYEMTNDDKEKIEESGREVVIVSNETYDKVKQDTDYNGNEIGTFNTVLNEYNSQFEYKWVDFDKLDNFEKNNLNAAIKLVFGNYGSQSYRDKIKISENINPMTNGDRLGVFDQGINSIVLKRSILKKQSQTCEVLFHELVHATTNYPDNDRNFENELGKIIGILSKRILDEETWLKEG